MDNSIINSVGELRHRLTIQRPAGTNDAPTWATVCTVWGAARDVSGSEFFKASAQQMENVTTFIIRWRTGLDTSMRILFGGNSYRIVQIDRLSYRGDFMRIRTRMTGGEGT